MHVVFIKFLQPKCTTDIYTVIIKNKGYASGLALGRYGVNCVSQWQLRDLLLHENLLLVLHNDLLKLVLAGGYNL
jgi:hypothetical protein